MPRPTPAPAPAPARLVVMLGVANELLRDSPGLPARDGAMAWVAAERVRIGRGGEACVAGPGGGTGVTDGRRVWEEERVTGAEGAGVDDGESSASPMGVTDERVRLDEGGMVVDAQLGDWRGSKGARDALNEEDRAVTRTWVGGGRA